MAEDIATWLGLRLRHHAPALIQMGMHSPQHLRDYAVNPRGEGPPWTEFLGGLTFAMAMRSATRGDDSADSLEKVTCRHPTSTRVSTSRSLTKVAYHSPSLPAPAPFIRSQDALEPEVKEKVLHFLNGGGDSPPVPAEPSTPQRSSRKRLRASSSSSSSSASASFPASSSSSYSDELLGIVSEETSDPEREEGPDSEEEVQVLQVVKGVAKDQSQERPQDGKQKRKRSHGESFESDEGKGGGDTTESESEPPSEDEVYQGGFGGGLFDDEAGGEDEDEMADEGDEEEQDDEEEKVAARNKARRVKETANEAARKAARKVYLNSLYPDNRFLADLLGSRFGYHLHDHQFLAALFSAGQDRVSIRSNPPVLNPPHAGAGRIIAGA